ncbi:hypothetical protein TVAG_182030 [Trichomonas vaginalis G3]|uniref:Uncharacterized protein n=1 Tax=Trichomonas vaginalis (strain ATCC PRA-98 / G3) TaxID=412133 RepID=A2F6Y5_TRIV3|nr:hypothetical protein TVAGG3_0007290 [Trichomonas vaginalis G3]EAX99346.1 hypothetical protein TVAG_182030 [Trichomonas vaginalis G3]KAI5538966.1 hypothetical protein TVAGG3_0007290 [Trichomonas vaginalis G3]|eukprot:XP_001312276.1 hypothetical protein [Trichomonas vaginalis G3]
METACNSLRNAIASGKTDSINQEFVVFSRVFHEKLKYNDNQNVIHKLFSKDTSYDQGISIYKLMVEKHTLAQMDYNIYVSNLINVFSYLLGPGMPLPKYRESYSVYLDLLSTLEIEPDTMQAFGNLLFQSTYRTYSPIFSQRQIRDAQKEKNVQFKQELIQILSNHIVDNKDKIEHWWYLLCCSILPKLKNDSLNKSFPNEEIYFNYQLILKLILDKAVLKKQHMYFKYPDLLLRLAIKVFSTNPDFVFQFYDNVEQDMLGKLFIKAVKRMDSESVSLFLVFSIKFFAQKFAQQESSETSTEYLKARNHYKSLIFDVWSKIIEHKYATLILDSLTEKAFESYEPLLIFSILLLSYKTGIIPPKDILSKISQMDNSTKSAAAAFSCILATVFAHQLLKVEQNFSFDRDCTTFVVKFENSDIINRHLLITTRHLIRGILIISDTRPIDQANEYLNVFFKKHEIDSSIFYLYSCFNEMLICIANYEIPPSISFDPLSVFESQIHKFIAISDGWLHPDINFTGVSILIHIIETRNCGHNMNPSMAIRFATAILRAVSLSDPNRADVSAYLLARAISIGCPIFYVLSSFFLDFIGYYLLEINPEPKIVSALISIAEFFRFHDFKMAIDGIETRVKQLLRDTQCRLSKFTQDFFFVSSPAKIEAHNMPISIRAEQLLADWLDKCPSTAILMAILITIQSVTASNFTPSQKILNSFSSTNSLKMFNGDVAMALNSLTEVCKLLNEKVTTFVDDLMTSLTNNFFVSQDICLLFLLVNYAITTDPKKNLTILLNRIIETKKGAANLFIDIIINHIGSINSTSSPVWNKIQADNAVSIGVSSQNILQIVEDVVTVSLVVTQTASGRSTHQFKPISKRKIEKDGESEVIEDKIKEPSTETVISEYSQPPPLFSYLREQLVKRGFEYLLTSSRDIANINIDQTEEVSPISSEGELMSSKLSSGSDDILFDTTYAAMAGLDLYGDFLSQANIPIESSDLKRLLNMPLRCNVHIPVTFYPKNCSDLTTAKKTKWDETSYLFQQFTSSLGKATKDQCVLNYSSWDADIFFEINPLLIKHGRMIMQKPQIPIEVIFFESYIPPFLLNSTTTPTIYILPLRTGLIRVEVSKLIQPFGPIIGEALVTPEVLPGLLRSTVACIWSSISPSEKSLKNLGIRQKMKKRINRIADNIKVHQFNESRYEFL